jgi:heptosyltransferase-2
MDEADVAASVTLLRVLEPMGIYDADTVPRINLSDPELNSGIIALHPGSGSESKNWTEENWCELISLILELENGKVKLMIVGGEAETKKVRRLRSKFPNPRLRVLLNETLTSLAHELTACQIYVGHDSGITHLAAALGVRCIVIWAQTNDGVWKPIGERVHILKGADNITMIEPRRVFEVVKRFTYVH